MGTKCISAVLASGEYEWNGKIDLSYINFLLQQMRFFCIWRYVSRQGEKLVQKQTIKWVHCLNYHLNGTNLTAISIGLKFVFKFHFVSQVLIYPVLQACVNNIKVGRTQYWDGTLEDDNRSNTLGCCCIDHFS